MATKGKIYPAKTEWLDSSKFVIKITFKIYFVTWHLLRLVVCIGHYLPDVFFDLIDLSVYYDLSSVQIHKALYKFLKSHLYVSKIFLKALANEGEQI